MARRQVYAPRHPINGGTLRQAPRSTFNKEVHILNRSKILATWWAGIVYHVEQLDLIINSLDIKNFAWILHDKCKNEDGKIKKPHYHFLVQFNINQRGSWFHKFNSDDMGIIFYEPISQPEGAFNYLTHETSKCKKENAFVYPKEELTSTIEKFEDGKIDDENQEILDDLVAIVNHKMTWTQFIEKKPKRIHMLANVKHAFNLLHQDVQGTIYFEHIMRYKNKPIEPLVTKEHVPILTRLSPKEAEDLPW